MSPHRPFRIGLTCDFLRFVPQGQAVINFQNRNLVWLAEMLRIPFHAMPELEISLIAAGENFGDFASALGKASIPDDYTTDPALAWARRYHAWDKKLFKPLVQALYHQDLIVGFEMPPALKKLLHEHEKRYLNLYIHPLRFLRDLAFGATTNCPLIAQTLQTHAIGAEEVTQQAQRWTAAFRRLNLPVCALPRNAPLLIGQTAQDSALIHANGFADWADYETVLAPRLQAFDTVAFLEHPYQSIAPRTVEFLRDSLGKNVITVRGNSYGVIFSNRATLQTITLSSSLGAEAQALGCSTDYLLSDPRAKFLLPEIDQPIFPMMGHILLDATLWRGICDHSSPKQISPETNSFFLGDHFLRDSLDSWAYRSLRQGIVVEPSIKKLTPSRHATPQRIVELATDCCGPNETPNPTIFDLRDRARGRGIDLYVLDPPLAPSERRELPIIHPEGAFYLSQGFHAPESWGVWSSARTSCLTIPVTVRQDYFAHLRLKLRIKVYDGIMANAPVLRLSTDKKDIGFIFFRSSRMDPVEIYFDCRVAAPSLQIHFEITDLQSPKAYCDSLDGRLLGFGLESILVDYRAETTEAETKRAPSFWGIDPEKALTLEQTA